MTFPLEVPAEVARFCQDWHAGQSSAFYSVSSTGSVYSADILNGMHSEFRWVANHIGFGPQKYDAGTWEDFHAAEEWLKNHPEVETEE